jgi:hypothetical protein
MCARLIALALTVPVLTLCGAVTAAAQTEGRIGVGASVTLNNTTDKDVGRALSIGPLVRVNPRPGLGFAGAFNWYRADLNNPDGGDSPFARLHVRPLMGGIGYTIGPPRTLLNFSVVAGPSFNKADFENEFRQISGGSPSIEAKTSFAIRPGVSITQTLMPRVGVVGFAGYMINRPKVVYRSITGQEVEDRWTADSLVLSVGLVYSIF